MLQAINDRIKGWLGAVVVALITVPFALWGIQAYLGGGDDQYAALVNGDEISPLEFDFSYKQQLGELTRQFGEQLPFSYDVIKSQVLDRLINTLLLERSTFSEGYRISDTVLKNNIREMFSRDGVFDRELYESVLASRGMTTTQFEAELRNELRVQQMQNALSATAIVTDAEVRRLAELDQQSRDLRVIRFETADYAADIAISEDEITAYYRSNIDRYMTPEKVRVDYIELTGEDIAGDIEPDEQRLQSLYDEYRTAMARLEERKARHILLEFGDEPKADKDAATALLQQIQQKLADGGSFQELAMQYSQDPGSANQGGDLGWVSAGLMAGPFEDALFDLKKGEVSGIVETQFGLHLIRLDDIRSEQVLSYEEKRPELVDQLKRDLVSGMFYDLSETMATTAYENPDSLDAVVDAMDLPVQTSELFSRQNGAGIAQFQKVRNAAFSEAVREQGLNSDLIEIAPDHVVVLRLNESIPASQRPLEEVRTEIEDLLRMKKGHEFTMAAALQARQKIIAGTAPEDVLSEGQSIESYPGIRRTDTARLDPLVLESSFSMPRPKPERPVLKEVNLPDGEVALVILDGVNTPETLPRDRLDIIKRQLSMEVARSDFNEVMNTIKHEAEIERNPQVLQ